MTLQNTPTTTGRKKPSRQRCLAIALGFGRDLLPRRRQRGRVSFPSIYIRLTPVFLPQALAQDVADLAIASPALLVLAMFALRGSLRAYLLSAGGAHFHRL